ncbi:hypothetical protein ACWEL8_03410 [Streptomyces sp. NPDC004690]
MARSAAAAWSVVVDWFVVVVGRDRYPVPAADGEGAAGMSALP